VSASPDEYQLENIALNHLIGVSIFIPFVIAQLAENAQQTEALLTIRLRNITDQTETEHRLRLTWSLDNLAARSLGVSERVITEWAACGVACVVLARYTSLRLCAVTGDGDRFDYWVREGDEEYGLEVSGTIADDLETRRRLKARQLRANPYGVDGYVIVVSFGTQEAVCSFHRFEEEE
jgi:hypothetical protein